ncbi:amidohydrolase [Leucobacter tardus]|nr:amidohydrolase [Leucobacter tardus]
MHTTPEHTATPDRIVLASRVHTMEPAPASDGPANPVTAIALSGDRVLATGTHDEMLGLRGPGTVIDDFAGTVYPGFTDSHTHVILGLELTRGLHLTDLDLDTVRARVAAAAAELPDGAWIHGWGADPNIFTGSGFTGRIFDDVAGDHPLFIRMRDAHSAVVNSTTIDLLGLTGRETFPDESRIGVDDQGVPTGYVLELAAIDLVLSQAPPETIAQQADRVWAVLTGMAASGIASTHVLDFHRGSREILELAEERGDLPVRLRFSPIVPAGASEAQLREFAELQGLRGRRWRVEGVKFMIDGTVDNGSAWLAEPDCFGQGLRSLWTDPEAYRAALRYFAERGVPTATHAIGDRGVDFVLDALESLGDLRANAAHRIEHIETIPDETVQRFAALGVAASMQPIHGTHHTRADRSDNWSVRLGDTRAARGWRCADIRRSGAVLALGSDWPVTPYDPRAMLADTILRYPVERPGTPPVQPEQALTRREALEGYTVHAAAASGLLDDEGTLAPGKRANLTVLDADLLDTPPERFPEVGVLATFVDGVPAHVNR